MPNLYIIDGSNCAFRAHCAFSGLTFEDFPIGAVYGVTRILCTFVKEFPVGRIIIPFDVSKSVHRLALYPEYKASREKNRDTQLRDRYILQLHLIYDLLTKFGVSILTEEARGVEADDVISYIIHKFKTNQFPSEYDLALIVSSDKDLCALVSKSDTKVVNWYDPISRTLVTADNFEDTFKVKLEQYVDFKCLRGDSSDNIQHPPGIGPGTAAKLLREYGTIDKMIEIGHAKISPYRDVLALARKLVALNLHEIDASNQVWSKIDEKIKQPTRLDPDLELNLEGLSFHSILEEWSTLKPKWEAFCACQI